VATGRGAKKRGIEFWRAAVEQMKGGKNAHALAEELGVDLRGLYRWRQKLDPVEVGAGEATRRQREAALVREVERLQRALAEKVLEVDFLQGALHKIEARRQGQGSAGAKASTTRSGK
jgi:predicted RNase H-like nuclease (RuvC/YqgF family)